MGDMQGKRIRIARQAKKLTLREVGEAMDVSPQAVAQWERSNPQFDDNKTYRLSNILEANIEWLRGNIGSDHEVAPVGYASTHDGRVPIVHIEDAIHFVPFSRNQTFSVESYGTIEPTVKIVGQAFALRIEAEDEIMLLREGDICIFDTGISPSHGDLIVCLVLHEGRYHSVIAGCYLDEDKKSRSSTSKDHIALPVLVAAPNSPAASYLKAPGGYIPVGILVEHRRLTKPWGLSLEKIQGNLVDTD